MKLALQAWQRAQNDFQYLFDNHRLTRNGEPYPDPAHYFARVVDFLNSPGLLGFVREITGLQEIVWADAQATLYRPGDFLNVHDDEAGGRKRLVAYVLNLTPIWRPDWGGALNFLGPTGHVEEGYVPDLQRAEPVSRADKALRRRRRALWRHALFGHRLVPRPLICATPPDPIDRPAA